ncbi:MAG: M28 family peptidase [Planctomycetia bacterium]|nr:M28 family peptidase [Planctomycetia bacterium]
MWNRTRRWIGWVWILVGAACVVGAVCLPEVSSDVAENLRPVSATASVTSEIRDTLEETITEPSLREIVGFLASPECEGRFSRTRGNYLAAEKLARWLDEVGFEPPGNDGFFQTFHHGEGTEGDDVTKNADVMDIAGKTERGMTGIAEDGAIAEEIPTKCPEIPVKRTRTGRPARNVIGVLRGSDLVLRDEYVLLVAHYDHLGRTSDRARYGEPISGESAHPIAPGEPHIASGMDGDDATDGDEPDGTDEPDHTDGVNIASGMGNVSDTSDGNTGDGKDGMEDGVTEERWESEESPDTEDWEKEENVDRAPPVQGEYWPGADDNASGCAGILAIGRFFATLPRRPERSVILAFVDAEEIGLIGSTWLAAHLPIPREKIVFVVNCDMVGRMEDRQLICGEEQSATGLRAILRELNADPVYHATDGRPFRISFRGTIGPISDHWPFRRLGIPGVVFHTGIHPDYHEVTDVTGKINFADMVPLIRYIAAFTYQIARTPERYVLRRDADTEGGVHTVIDDETLTAFEQDWGFEYGVDPSDPGVLVVLEPAPDGAAGRAGLERNDRILSIRQMDGCDTGNMAPVDFENRWNERSATLPGPIGRTPIENASGKNPPLPKVDAISGKNVPTGGDGAVRKTAPETDGSTCSAKSTSTKSVEYTLRLERDGRIYSGHAAVLVP